MRKEHPRPQFVRKDWLNLNGVWTCEYSKNIKNLMRIDNIDGFLIGGASTNEKIFIDIMKKSII